jgi:hypothetical protein
MVASRDSIAIDDSGSGHLKEISTVAHLVFYKHFVLQPVGKMAENPICVQNRSRPRFSKALQT